MIPALSMVVPNKEIVCAFPKGKPNKTKMRKPKTLRARHTVSGSDGVKAGELRGGGEA